MSKRTDLGGDPQASNQCQQPPAMEGSQVPLIVDLDGTLVCTDLLHENLMHLAATQPWRLIRAGQRLLGGKAGFKAWLAEAAELSIDHLPYNDKVIALVKEARLEGRPVYLATATNRRLAEAVADRLGLFDGVLASDEHVNLSAAAKAEALMQRFGPGRFDYVGNSRADLPVWQQARHAILIDPPAAVERAARAQGNVSAVLRSPRSLLPYIKTLRPHHWLKNILILIPILAAHEMAAEPWLAGVAAVVAFSICASSAYLFNDLVDLPHDRAHHSRRHRPIAAGALPVKHAIVMVPVLLAGAFGLAVATLPASFIGLLGGYFAATVAYSLILKRFAIIDVIILGGLYTTRIIAGGLATGIVISDWLFAFSMLLFLCLAIVKRQTELIEVDTRDDRVAGRGYRVSDLSLLSGLAAASGYGAVVVLGLYISSDTVAQSYSTPKLLWIVCVLFLYWISHVLLLTHRGEMHADPVVFAATDKISFGVAIAVGATVLMSL